MLAVSFPQEILLLAPSIALWLVFAFDWDSVTISPKISASLSSEITLCAEYFPCSLLLRGGAMDVSENGQLACLSSAGCEQISVQSVAFSCRHNSRSALKMQGSALTVTNTSFIGCKADSDGGVIQAYDMAVIDIDTCRFADIYSSGFGGAVAAYGSNLSISNSWLNNCSSRSGGGAVWASAFQDCYGSIQTHNTQLKISWSVFSQCRTVGAGGAVLADSSSVLSGEVLDVSVSHSSFSWCTSVAEGGAVRITGSLVVAQLQYTEIESCVSDASGGAISSSGLSSLSLMACSIHDNIAKGVGGGAVHLNKSFFSGYNLSVLNNRAPWGGGGAFLWQGWVKPAAIWCPEGMGGQFQASCASDASDPSACQMGSCVPCGVGTFQGVKGGLECSPCNAGTFSEIMGALECRDCPFGKYSTVTGANRSSVCVVCGPGMYTEATGSSACRSCPPGTYSSEVANSSQPCSICSAGTYSLSGGAISCLVCEAGMYSEVPGSSFCSSCPAGTYSSSEAANSSQLCSSCPEGTYSFVPGANSSSICGLCYAGTYSEVPGSSLCSSCPAGTYSSSEAANSSQLCSSCHIGTYSSLNGANSSSVCIVCDAGMYSEEEGSSLCSSCPEGTFSSCEAANSSQICSSCLAGTYASLTGMTMCESCLAGTYSELPGASSCISCPVGQYSPNGATSLKACSACVYGTSGAHSISDRSSLASQIGFLMIKQLSSSEWYQKPESQDEDLNNVALTATLLKSKNLELKQILSLFSASLIEDDDIYLRPTTNSTLRSGKKEVTQTEIKHPPQRIPIFKKLKHENDNIPNRSVRKILVVGVQLETQLQLANISPGAIITNESKDSFMKILCGANNSALYGSCIASSFCKLQVSKLAEIVYTGLLFNFSVSKLDAYGNIILSDSSSILQAIPTLSSGGIDGRTAIISSARSTMEDGTAFFLLQIQVTFLKIDYIENSATLYAPIFLSIEGIDAEFGGIMNSSLVALNVQDGASVCPEGYILQLEEVSIANVPAICTFCKAGTYSVSPLAHLPGAVPETPTCLNCPVGGDCNKGGADVEFRLGTWTVVDGIYILKSCPPGYQLLNSTSGTSQETFSYDVQQCTCLPGYELLLDQTCSVCPSNYFCLGGSSGRQSCPDGSFSAPGAATSAMCVSVVFVQVIAELPVSQNNFTTYMQLRFQLALALTACVPIEKVVVIAVQSRRNTAAFLRVNSEIASDNTETAGSTSKRVSLASLNTNLKLQGLPNCSNLSVTVESAGMPSQSSADSLPAVLGGSVGGLVMFLGCSVASYFLVKLLKKHWTHTAFMAAMKNAKAGEEASVVILPPDIEKESFSLRTHFTAKTVLKKGSRSCVVRAVNNKYSVDADPTNKSSQTVVIKIIIPNKGKFNDEEKRRINREADLLQLVTQKQCKSAVQAADYIMQGLPQRADVCWLIMESLGPSAAVVKPVGDAACIQMARDVLAALKVLHGEFWVHGDVNPSNIVHCAPRKDGYEFKLIDFGSALRTHTTFEGGGWQRATGAPAYRAPEIFIQPCMITCSADLWSLGVSLFELAAGNLPFDAGNDWEEYWATKMAGDMERWGSDVSIRSPEGRSVDTNLVKAIIKALDKNIKKR